MTASLLRISLLALLVASGVGRADDKPVVLTAGDKPVVLTAGDKAPAITARTDADATWESKDRFGKKWVVVYFYPGDFTPGCTAQAKAFQTAMAKLTEKGVEVVGVSGDSIATHALFKKAQKLNFTLLADEEGALCKLFGVPFTAGATVKSKDADGKPLEFQRAGTAARWTFLVGPDGKIAYKNVKVIPADNAKKIAEFIDAAEKK
jgi:peroxiredoxin Q/BCP